MKPTFGSIAGRPQVTRQRWCETPAVQEIGLSFARRSTYIALPINTIKMIGAIGGTQAGNRRYSA